MTPLLLPKSLALAPWLKALGPLQHQDRPNLQRRGPAFRGEGHQIVRTYPLKPAEREHGLTLSEIRATPPMTKTAQGIKRPRSLSKRGAPSADSDPSQRVRSRDLQADEGQGDEVVRASGGPVPIRVLRSNVQEGVAGLIREHGRRTLQGVVHV